MIRILLRAEPEDAPVTLPLLHDIRAKRYTAREGSSFVIRQVTESDAPHIERNINAICQESLYLVPDHFKLHEKWKRILQAQGELDGHLIIVAEVEGQVVGHGRLFPEFGESKDKHVADLGMAIIKSYRGLGLGTAMMEYMIDWAKEHGLEKLTLGVFASNQRAINLYRKFGFVMEGMRAKQYKINGHYVDEWLMAKFL